MPAKQEVSVLEENVAILARSSRESASRRKRRNRRVQKLSLLSFTVFTVFDPSMHVDEEEGISDIS